MINPSSSGGGMGGLTITFSAGPVLDPRKSDIISVSKAMLRSLRSEINAALPGYSDNMSKYHLIDLRERIDKIFNKD